MSEARFEVTTDGITVSKIVFLHLGYPSPSMIKKVYDTNPELRNLGVFLPRGTIVTLPSSVEETGQSITTLWD